MRFKPSLVGLLIFSIPFVHAGEHIQEAIRFQFLQSTLTARDTFLIDRFTGTVFRTVVDSSGQTELEVIPIQGGKARRKYQHPAYRLFLSTITARDSYLVDEEAGVVWQIVEGKLENSTMDFLRRIQFTAISDDLDEVLARLKKKPNIDDLPALQKSN